MLKALHQRIRVGDTVDCRARACRSGQCRRRGLHHLTQHKKIADEIFRGLRLQVPSKHVGIEQVPVGPRPDACTNLRPRDNESFGRQLAVGFPQRRSRYRKTCAHIFRTGQQRSGWKNATNDFAPERSGDVGMNIALKRLIVAIPARPSPAGRNVRFSPGPGYA